MPKKKYYPGYPNGGQVRYNPQSRGAKEFLDGLKRRRARERLSIYGHSDVPDWLADNPELVEELMNQSRSKPPRRPLPPIVTRENIGMMTPEEIREWGGLASGGIVGLQSGGRVGDPQLGKLRALESRARQAPLGAQQASAGALSRYREAAPSRFEAAPSRRGREWGGWGTPPLSMSPSERRDIMLEQMLQSKKEIKERELERRLERELGIGRASGGLIGLQQGGPAPGGTAVTQSYVNPAVARQYANLTDRIVQEGQRAYQPYNQQRIAGFTTPEAMAQQAAINYGMGMGPQGTIQAGQTLGQAGQMIQGAQQGLAGQQPQ